MILSYERGEKMDVVLSGMRSTGNLHIGHLKGVLENWIELQDKYSCFFFIADWHALTTEYDNTNSLKEFALEILAEWLAVGLDPEKSVLFVQSQVKEHAELHLLLSMITPIAWLERVPSYKEMKTQLKKDLNTYGFLGYPVLQAADIIIYKAKYVPVGEDQVPHVELTREIVRRFHYLFKKEVFVEPQELINRAARVKGLDGRKMSKSYGNAIYLADPTEVVKEKIMNAVTDPARIRKTDPGHPDICNVYHYHKLFSPPDEVEELERKCKAGEIGCVQCKRNLFEKVESVLAPIREKRERLLSNRDELIDILRDGARRAREVASKTMEEVREAVGLIDL